MPKVVACFKWVLDEADISVRNDASVDFSRARGKISDYDRQAIQAAIDAAQELGAQAVGLTLVPRQADAASATKEGLVRGLEECYVGVIPEDADADSRASAKGMAAGLAAIDDVILVICGSGSSDSFSRQIPPRLAALKDWPLATSVNGMEFNGNSATLRCAMENSIDEVSINLPAVVSVTPEINTPPLPGMKAILAAKKKPVIDFACDEAFADDGKSARTLSTEGYVSKRQNNILENCSAAEAAAFLFDALQKEGVL